MQLTDQEFDQMLAFLKVLADRSRLKIVGHLAEREYTVKELASVLGLKEPTVSEHLAMMRANGVVEMRQEGTAHYYRMRMDEVHGLLKSFKPRSFVENAEPADSSEFERHVLKHFFRDDQLLQIPVQFKKQLVILNHLVKQFDFGVLYPEKQVNEILKRFHPDCATLRRLMVDNRLMTRSNSVYQRLPLPEEEQTPTMT